MDVVSAPVLRMPAAAARFDGQEWWVDSGPQREEVLPRGVHRDDDFDNAGRTLAATLHEVVEHLSLTATMPDDQAAAEHLAEHARRFTWPDLCSSHGLPVFHDGAPRRGCPVSDRLRLGHVRRMVDAFDGIADAADHLQRQRRPLPTRIARDILEWGITPHSRTRAAVVERDNGLRVQDARHLVRTTLDGAARAADLHLSTRWQPQRRPELALVAETTVALYVADTLAHVGTTSDDRTFVCSVCGQPFTPKRAPRPGDGLYCRRPECQRERARIRQAHHRDRQRKAGRD